MPSVLPECLKPFHPEISSWFAERVGRPTEIQEKAWRLISEEKHCLISAATGSGKTLAAFLWGINQLASGAWETGQTRVLYISPLKALNNDIRRNLLQPLEELERRFASAGRAWPEIRVQTRSGDTEQADRRRMLRQPPEILITTPESLNLLLTSKSGRQTLRGIRSVVLDEIHSVVGSKRGVYLMTAIERLARWNGEFQRIALSATVRPMNTVAAFVGGLEKGKPRHVELAESTMEKRYEIAVRFPEAGGDAEDEDQAWQPIVEDLKRLFATKSSTLVFVNSRRLCEKLAYLINLEEPVPIAYSHHGSLSKEIRAEVEQRLKLGELKAIVATNSLEMGIDVGALDCVVMVQCPGSISSAVQKVGRAGHQVGATSQAMIFPSHARDFLESAVLSESIRTRDIEAVSPVERPLDVLAQVIVSTLGAGPWDVDELFELMRSSYPYRDLSRESFDLTINLLAGRYAGSRLRELKPRIALDAAKNTATLRKGALLAYYFSGGVIVDRGLFHMRHSGSGARLGELDEEFVWERKIGDVFTLGVQNWQIERITYNDVFVVPAVSSGVLPPFWRAETYDRDFHYASRIAEFLEWANEHSGNSGFEVELEKRFAMESSAAGALSDFLCKQKLVTNCDLPHRHHLLVELIASGPAGAPGNQMVLHTQWGGRVNRPFAFALDAAWEEAFGYRADLYVNNDCVAIGLSEDVTVDEALALVNSGNVETWLRRRLEGSGFFGARFREAAGTSLLITRQRAGQRLPLWLSRMRAKKLFEAVSKYDDFPLLLEAWRTCLKDEFDMESLKQVLVELEQGEIGVSVARGSVASPFAASVAWRQINDEYMYADDAAPGGSESKLREDLVRSVAFDSEQRPRVPKEVIRNFEEKRQRRTAGYEPSDALELKEWLRDRILLEEEEWRELCSSMENPPGTPSPSLASTTTPVAKLGLGVPRVYLAEEEAQVRALLAGDPDLVVEWLSFFGPVSMKWLQDRLEVSLEDLTALVDALVDERRLVAGLLRADSEETYVCEAENFEILLRMNRARSRPSFEARPVEELPLFLAHWQGLIRRGEGSSGVGEALDRLLGVVAPVDDWESLLLPARVADYQSAWLDSSLAEDGGIWFGAGQGKVGFCLEEDWELISAEGDEDEDEDVEEEVLRMLRESGGQYSFSKLLELTGLAPSQLEQELWSLVWSGSASNDSFAAARRGLAGKFALGEGVSTQSERRTRPSRFGRRARSSKGFTYPGSWYALPEIAREEDALSSLEEEKERARIVLGRYGVVFRELLQRESSGFRWRDLFKAFRLLELSGEIFGGRFFEGVPGLQFVSKEALRALRGKLPQKAIYWLGATDPASVCGLGLEGLKGSVPKRVSSTRLVYRGTALVLEIQRGGKALKFHVEPSEEDLPEILAAYEDLLSIGGRSIYQSVLEDINGEDARTSPYLESLSVRFRLHSDHKRVVIEGAV